MKYLTPHDEGAGLVGGLGFAGDVTFCKGRLLRQKRRVAELLDSSGILTDNHPIEQSRVLTGLAKGSRHALTFPTWFKQVWDGQKRCGMEAR